MLASIREDLCGGKVEIAVDSGAFPVYKAKTKGKIITIGIERLIFFLLVWRNELDLCFALDVIHHEDDPDGFVSHQNWLHIRRFKPDVIPVHHWDKDVKFLETYLRESPIVGLGGRDMSLKKRREEFEHIWQTDLLDRHGKPRAKIHGLGVTSAELVALWPWYSVDSTSWAIDAGNKRILVPQRSRTGSGFDYTKTPIRVSVTLRSYDLPRDHISKLPRDKADHVHEYLLMMGFPLGMGYKSNPCYEHGLCNDRTLRYQINAIFYSELGRATDTKVFLAGNFESMPNPEMERKIRQAVFDRGLDYYRMVSFIDYPKITNIMRMKKGGKK